MSKIDTLLAAAASAKPPPAGRGKYASYLPVVKTLIKRGFKVVDACAWVCDNDDEAKTWNAKQRHSFHTAISARLSRSKAAPSPRKRP